jgi:hypothetical protein
MGDRETRLKGMRAIFAAAIVLIALYIGIGHSAVQAPETASAVGSAHVGSSPATADAGLSEQSAISVSVVIPPELALGEGDETAIINRTKARGPYGLYPPGEAQAPATRPTSIAKADPAPAREDGSSDLFATGPSDPDAEAAAAESGEAQEPAGLYYLLVTSGVAPDPVAPAKPKATIAAKAVPTDDLFDSEPAPSDPATPAGASRASGGTSATSGGSTSGSGGTSTAGSAGPSSGSGSSATSGTGGSTSGSGGTSGSGTTGDVVGAAGNAVGGAVNSVGNAAAGAVKGVSNAAGGVAGATGAKLGK